MTKVVPVKMSDALYERLQQVAERVGEPDSTIIRLVLRAGLAQIERDKYQVFRFDESFTGAGENRDADAGGLSIDSTPRFVPPPQDVRLNEADPTEPTFVQPMPRAEVQYPKRKRKRPASKEP